MAFGLQFLSGCVGLTASISSRPVPGEKINRAASFCFPVPDGASNDDRKIIQAFIEEFRVLGLEVVSESRRSESGYVVAVGFVDKSSVTTGSMAMSQTQFSTIRNVQGLQVGMIQSGSTAEVPYSADYRVRTVDVSMYVVAGMGPSARVHPVWNGSIVSEAGALSSHSRCIVRELVRRLGTDYHAQTRIDIACRSR
ncbi:hypothetical protein EPO15_06340 [bacterium]|nr:MAG: hypothetical protein EPO15_06340 [bacterium]